jgi:xanthine dehydrogenase accessory factor
VRGSAPREPGACMLVSPADIQGTIGGGNLEWQAIQAARTLLAKEMAPSVSVRRLVLGSELGQCCGGVVQLWLERFTRGDLPLLRSASQAISRTGLAVIATDLAGAVVTRRLLRPGAGDPHAATRDTHPRLQFSSDRGGSATLLERVCVAAPALWLYGAGHVGQALIRVLAELPFEITWIDARAELFPDRLPDNVHPLLAHTPLDTVPTAPHAARYLVMTHEHALDYELCRAILARGDFTSLGLIGSESKGARFRSRLARDGVAPEIIARLICPIGVDGVNSKWPAAIAIGVAAQLLQDLESAPATHETNQAASAALGADPNCDSRDCAACRSGRESHS